MMLEYFLAWFLMLLIAIANGAFRQKVLMRRYSSLQASQLSSLSIVVLFFLYVNLLHLLAPIESSAQAMAIGVMWLSMTIISEFVLGHYLFKQAWSVLLHDYNIFAGRLWSLVLLAILFLPNIVFQLYI